MIIVALDPGTKRVGVAVSDPSGTMALPVAVVDRKDIDAIVEAVRDRNATEVIVGLPRRLDSTEGPAAKVARRFAAEVSERLDIPVHLVDERLTTVEAGRSLQHIDSRKRRRVIDRSAAAVLLQSYLDSL